MFSEQMSIEYHQRTIKFYTPNKATQKRVRKIFSKEPITISWIDSMQAGDIMIDIGANVGMYSLLAAAGRKIRVYSFEPEVYNFFILNANIRLNGVDEICTAWNAGILDYDGQNFLHVSDTGGFGFSVHSVDEEVNFDLTPKKSTYKQGINIFTLNSFCKNMGIKPDHVKIDVDGLEHRIVSGNLHTLNEAKTVLIEIQTDLEQHKNAVSQMLSLGFKLDPLQVKTATRMSGPFKGAAEHLFYR